jgi:carboxyl-terminal processing protease
MLRGDDFRELNTAASGNYGGIGTQIDVRDGWITVVAPLPDTPAERAGIRAGDRIIALNDTSTRDWSPDKGLNALRGDPGTPVRLTVQRAGMASNLTFSLRRAEIHVRSVQFAMSVAPGVGYVQLTVVSDSSTQELEQAIDRLKAEGAHGVILDLRNNPGGLLNEGIGISELFLDKGQVIVDTRGRGPEGNEKYSASSGQRWAGLPVVVLVDEGTASAAEIIAGALQDHDRAVLVGNRTFGKGLVQSLFPLGPDQALKLTTSRWFTPNGRSIQRVHDDDRGVSVAPKAGTATDTVRRFRTDQGRLMAGGGGIQPDVVVPGAAFTSSDSAFLRLLGPSLPAYRDVLTAYALDLKARGGVASPAFTVTPAMLGEIRQRLAARHVVVPEALWHAATARVSQQAGAEIARYVFSRQDEFRRSIPDDLQLQRAMALLAKARTPAELISAARDTTR